MCSELDEEPDPAKAPTRLQDLSATAQLAWEYYLVCRYQVISTPVGVAGLSFSEVKTVMDIYGLPQYKRRAVFDRIRFIYYWVEARSINPEEAK